MKFVRLLILCVLTVAMGLTGCSGDTKEKGAAEEDSKTSPEAQKIINDMQNESMRQKQFGSKADQVPETK